MDSNTLKQTLELFSALDIDYLSLQDGEFSLELKKAKAIAQENATLVSTSPVATEAAPAVAETAPVAAPQATPSEAPAAEAPSEEEDLHKVTSPIIGTLYHSPAPGKPEFVQVGDKVKKGQVLCIVEAMKVMNNIESDVDGEIVEVLAEAESAVEFGTPLFSIRS